MWRCLPISDASLPNILSEPEEEGAKSISGEMQFSIITITKEQISENDFSVPYNKKRARPASPKSSNSGIEWSNSFSPLEKSPNVKKAVSVEENSEASTSNATTSTKGR